MVGRSAPSIRCHAGARASIQAKAVEIHHIADMQINRRRT